MGTKNFIATIDFIFHSKNTPPEGNNRNRYNNPEVDNLTEASREARDLMKELRKRPWRLMRRVKGEKKKLLEELEQAEAAKQPPPP